MTAQTKFSKLFWPRLYLPLLLLLCVAYAWRPLEGGFDFWAHAAVGKWIWANQQVPRTSLFLWSEPNAPWVAHSWLSELLFYGLIAQGGPRLVVVFSTAVATLTFFLLWRVWKQEAPMSFWVPLVFAFAIWVSAPRFLPRQEAISALFLVLLLAFLIAWQNGRFDDWLREKGIVDASLVAVPLIALFFFWVNLHALVAVGLLILLLTIVADGAQALFGSDRYDGPARSRVRILLAVGILCAGATLCNPYGLNYWTAAEILKSGSQAQYVQEWKPLWADPPMWIYAAVSAGLCLAALLTWLANPQRRWAHFLWLALSATLLIRSRRMLWLSAIIFLAIMAANARYLDTPTVWRRWRKITRGDQSEPLPLQLRPIGQIGAVICLVAWVYSTANHTLMGEGKASTFVKNVPEGAANFLHRAPKSRRIFNDYEHGSYFQWRLNGAPAGNISARGRHPLYIDLLNAYPDRLLFEYFDILAANPRGLQKLREREIEIVVLGNRHWKQPLVKYLTANKNQWRLALSDKQSKIRIRRAADAR